MTMRGRGRASWLLLFFGDVAFCGRPLGTRAFGDFAGETFQLLAVEYGIVDHAEDELLGGASAETVDDVLNGADSDVLARVGGFVDEGAAVDGVGEVAFFFEAAEHGADGGILHGTGGGESFAACLGGGGAVGPDVIHDELFDFAHVL